ncbi:maltase 1-like [Planococcus citri]|uniref:maltase 1-like n=1 Tax=Planococcus citri TaxID=170843 RepID=UPI0031F8C966
MDTFEWKNIIEASGNSNEIRLQLVPLLHCEKWWKHTIIYELIPYTFKDSDGDGIGDIKGITSKLDHFFDLGIETIHLTPILGTISDLEELIREMNKKNMKLILDLVINHSGYKHEWFQKSIDQIDPYTDFYVWKNSEGIDNVTNLEIPPNKWVNIFSQKPGSGWTWNEKRRQFYFHQFLVEQPDFDLSNDNLKKELWKMIEFWLNKSVAGFRLDATPFFFEDKEFRDDVMYLRQINQPETIEFIHEFRTYLDKYNEDHGGFERIFVAEAHGWGISTQYDRENYTVTHIPYAFLFEYISFPANAMILKNYLQFWSYYVPEGKIYAWMTQDHDDARVGSRIVPEYADIFTILSMMLPGTVGVYYGQEIAMMNGFATEDQFKDFSGGGLRDPNRLLMQWDDSLNAGKLLKVNIDYDIDVYKGIR